MVLGILARLVSCTFPTLFTLRHADPFLHLDFAGPQRFVSFALHHGPAHIGRGITWMQVRNADLPTSRDPIQWLQSQLAQRQRGEDVAMMTSAPLANYLRVRHQVGSARSDAVATVGLSNACAIASPTPLPMYHRFGTINIAVAINISLSPNAALEALTLCTEARTAAILLAWQDARPSARIIPSQLPTGTGTDCIVVAHPVAAQEAGHAYCGKHTDIGVCIGYAVFEAVYEGARRWLANPRQTPDWAK